jgi:hypothetical protein
VGSPPSLAAPGSSRRSAAPDQLGVAGAEGAQRRAADFEAEPMTHGRRSSRAPNMRSWHAELDPHSSRERLGDVKRTRGTAGASNPKVRNQIRASPQVAKPAREHSQGGDTGSNPVGTTHHRGRSAAEPAPERILREPFGNGLGNEPHGTAAHRMLPESRLRASPRPPPDRAARRRRSGRRGLPTPI